MCRTCYVAKFRANYKLHFHEYEQNRKERYRSEEYKLQAFKARIKRKYGLEYADYTHMLEKQNNKCFLCENPPSKNKLHIDHCHKTLKVRGLLCAPCNWFLGKVDNDATLLEKMRIYVGQ